MRCYDFIFYAFVIKSDSVFCVITSKNKKIFYCELVLLRPADFKTLLLIFRLFKGLLIEQIVNFFIINLQKRNTNRYSAILNLTSLLVHVFNSSGAEPSIVIIQNNFTCAIIFVFFWCILVALHRVSLPRPCLAIRKYRSVESFQYFSTQSWYLKTFINLTLRRFTCNNLIELKCFSLLFRQFNPKLQFSISCLTLLSSDSVVLAKIIYAFCQGKRRCYYKWPALTSCSSKGRTLTATRTFEGIFF